MAGNPIDGFTVDRSTIKYIGEGEKLDQLTEFHPERMRAWTATERGDRVRVLIDLGHHGHCRTD